ncbi:hypothetical protein ACRALDRAFT_210495 [Sodiomyces alcalophilus JCM 7366]|uniref:uncharacterized protein n=1 Tax=Sodiomyces alcalophilus JCM 7366 TaxID=591952 RepID=UPI0039B6E5EA
MEATWRVGCNVQLWVQPVIGQDRENELSVHNFHTHLYFHAPGWLCGQSWLARIPPDTYAVAMLQSQSPLKVRSSLHRLRKCPRRRELLLRLLWPIPWHVQAPSQLSPTELQSAAGQLLSLRQPGILQLYYIPLFRMRDTSLCSLYRCYEDLCARDLVMLSYECDYFFSHSEPHWRLSRLPDPRESDPVRSAVLASLVEALAIAFNWKLRLGLRRCGSQSEEVGDQVPQDLLETAPPWTTKVRPLAGKLDLRLSEQDDPDPSFLKRNIYASTGYIAQNRDPIT